MISSGKTCEQVARELGCSAYSLHLWKKQYLAEMAPLEVEGRTMSAEELEGELELLREGIFAATSILGSLLLNVAAKHSFARMRPDLWKSVSPAGTTYSFPSGHAMGSMTLAAVVVLLCWDVRTRTGGLR